MGRASREIKPRPCKKCGVKHTMTAAQLAAHAAGAAKC